MKKFIKYFVIILTIICITSTIILTTIIYKNIINEKNIQIKYINEINDNSEYLVNISYKNPKTNLYCSKDNKNWLKINDCNVYQTKGTHTIYIKNKYNVKKYTYTIKEKYEGTITSNIDMLDVYYLALNGTKKIDILLDYPTNYDTTYKWYIDDEAIIKIENDIIYGLKTGTTNLTIKLKDGNTKTYKITVTDLIVPPSINPNKKTLTCNKYTAEQNLLLDEILESRVKEAGIGTRGGVVAAARFLTLEFPYNISYFAENGRLKTGGIQRTIDGEGRYYHKGLYLSEIKYKELQSGASTISGPKPWGCSIYSIPMSQEQANGLDCSGFVSWALYNGGFDIGDVGAGDNVELDYELSDMGEHKKISFDYMKNGNYKVGDYIAKNGHAALIIGIDDKNIYTAESLGKGLRAKTYERYEGIVYSPILDYVIEMDEIYPNGEGNYEIMWN